MTPEQCLAEAANIETVMEGLERQQALHGHLPGVANKVLRLRLLRDRWIDRALREEERRGPSCSP